jgi:hypothetical protein
VEFSSPELPEGIDYIELTNLRVEKGSVDLRLRRDGGEVRVDVLRADEDIRIDVHRKSLSSLTG